MSMKKTMCLILALALVLALASCHKGGVQEELDDLTNGEGGTPGANGSGEPNGSGQDDESNQTGGENTPSSGSDGYSYDMFSSGLDSRGFFEGVTARDIVTLPDYKNVQFPTVADEDQVEAYILEGLRSYSEPVKVTEGVVEDGASLNIDFVGSVDGVEFEGGNTNGQGYDVTIGVTSFIDDFLEQLIGHRVGENFDIEVTFPTPYQNNPDLAGKDAVFNITINYLNQYVLNEETAAQLGCGSVEEVRQIAQDAVLSQAETQVMNDLLAKAQCENVPESVLATVHNLNMLNYWENAHYYYDMELEDYAAALGFDSLEAFEEALAPTDRSAAVMFLAAQAIAEIEGLEVTPEDITAAGAESAVETYGEGYVKFSLLNGQVIPDHLKLKTE